MNRLFNLVLMVCVVSSGTILGVKSRKEMGELWNSRSPSPEAANANRSNRAIPNSDGVNALNNHDRVIPADPNWGQAVAYQAQARKVFHENNF